MPQRHAHKKHKHTQTQHTALAFGRHFQGKPRPTGLRGASVAARGDGGPPGGERAPQGAAGGLGCSWRERETSKEPRLKERREKEPPLPLPPSLFESWLFARFAPMQVVLQVVRRPPWLAAARWPASRTATQEPSGGNCKDTKPNTSKYFCGGPPAHTTKMFWSFCCSTLGLLALSQERARLRRPARLSPRRRMRPGTQSHRRPQRSLRHLRVVRRCPMSRSGIAQRRRRLLSWFPLVVWCVRARLWGPTFPPCSRGGSGCRRCLALPPLVVVQRSRLAARTVS